jgi:hypothetical protein
VVVVFAVGNGSTFLPQTGLLALRETIKVAATSPDDSAAPFSNWGRLVDVAAPGGGSPGMSGPPREDHPESSILSLRASCVAPSVVAQLGVGDGYLRAFGTSVAAPHVSGLAALILACRPDLTNEAVRQVLRTSANSAGSPGFNFRTGYGRINAARALQIEAPPVVRIIEPREGLALTPQTKKVRVCGVVSGPCLRDFQLFYSRFDDLTRLWPISEPVSCSTEGQVLEWDVCDLPVGAYLLRLVATNQDGQVYEDTVSVARENPAIVALVSSPVQPLGFCMSGKSAAWAQEWAAGAQIVLLDIETKVTTVVAELKALPNVLAISNGSIVYDVRDDSSTSLRLHVLASGEEKTLASTPSLGGPFSNLALSGKRVAWAQAMPDGSSSVLALDLSTGATTTVANGLGTGTGGLAIDGDRLVFSDGVDLSLADLASGVSGPLAADAASGGAIISPTISGEDVLWLEQKVPGRFDIRHHDLRTGATRTIREALDFVQNLSIAGGLVAWADARNAKSDVYLYNLDSNQERAVTAGFDPHNAPAISGNRIVWLTATGSQTVIDLFEAPT